MTRFIRASLTMAIGTTATGTLGTAWRESVTLSILRLSSDHNPAPTVLVCTRETYF